MVYEVTATRRRPQKFEDLVGQEFVAQTFKKSIESGKIAHAYLFSGPRGCGKTSTARILAKALNCKNGPTATPCGQCESCKEITAGSSLDVIEIDGASNTSVNDVRQIKDEVLFPPNSSRYKIYIIDEVHMLSTSAFNALLKTIEEPPPYVVFIFATTELQKVPATIKSRCQQFNFRLVPIEKVKEQLALAAQEIGIKAEDEALYWIAKESTGSMRDSYTLFDQVAAFSDGEITYEKIRDKLGLVGVDQLNELFTLCVEQKSDQVLLKFDEYLQNGVSLEQLISNCTDYLRSLLLIKNGITRDSLLGNNIERYSKEVLDSWNSVKLERALSIFLQLYRDIRYSLSPRYEAELALSRLCWLKDYVSSTELRKSIDAVKPLLKEASYPRKIYLDQEGNAVPQEIAENPAVLSQNSQFSQENSQFSQQKVPVSPPSSSASSQNQQNSSGALPTFSALDSPSFSSPQNQQESFKRGGAEPPLNKSAVSFTYDGNYENFNDGSEDDDEDDFIPSSQDEAESALKTYENFENQEAKQNESNPLPNINEKVSLDLKNPTSVRNFLIEDLSFSDAMLASALMKTENWQINGTIVSCTTKQKFESFTLKENLPKIVEKLSKIFSSQMDFKIELEEKSEVKNKEVLPQIVQQIRDEFRGSVVGWN